MRRIQVLSTLIVTLFFALPQTIHAGWSRFFGGVEYDRGSYILETDAENFIVVGSNREPGQERSDLWILEVDKDGNMVWSKNYGSEEDDNGSCIEKTDDGNYVIVGRKGFSVWILKTSQTGDTIWTKVYGNQGFNSGFSVSPTVDDGYIVIGEGRSDLNSSSDLWLIKTDDTGDTVWTRKYGNECDDRGKYVMETEDGGFILIGRLEYQFSGEGCLWLLKTDEYGDTLWTKEYGSEYYDYGDRIVEAHDGGYLLLGSISVWDEFGYEEYRDIWVLKVGSLGDTLWTKTYGGDNHDYSYRFTRTQDQCYVIAGNTYSFDSENGDIWLIKIDTLGDTVWTRTYGGSACDACSCIKETSDGGLIVVGNTYSYGSGSQDLWLLKLDSLGLLAVDEPVTPAPLTHQYDWQVVNAVGREIVIRYSNSPGCSTPTIVIYDALGRKVDEVRSCRSHDRITWPVTHQPSGVYFIKVEGNNQPSHKVVLLK